MTSVSFRLRRSFVRNVGLTSCCLSAACLALGLSDFGYLITQSDHGPVLKELLNAGSEPWWYAVSGAVLLVSGLAGLLFGVRFLRAGLAGENRILLDGNGLTFILWGRVQSSWPWRELTEFRISNGWLVGRRSIKFAVLGPKSARSSHRLRCWVSCLWYHLRPGLKDVYDAPLDEIAERLNEYRDRALALEPR